MDTVNNHLRITPSFGRRLSVPDLPLYSVLLSIFVEIRQVENEMLLALNESDFDRDDWMSTV